MTTPSPVEALRACLFCGEPPDLDATDKHDYMHQISCPGCDITMMASAVSPDLVTAWNTRAALPLAEQQEKAFATMLEALEDISDHSPTLAGRYKDVYRDQIADIKRIARTAIQFAEQSGEGE